MSRTRRILIVLAMVAVTAVMLAAEPASVPNGALKDGVSEQNPPTPGVVDLTAPVESVNCTPCHATLGETDLPNLKFSHGAHLLVKCVACHQTPPHESGTVTRPTMQSCFLCHGVSHGDQGALAAAGCAKCHTPKHTLRPRSHIADWKAKPHAEVGLRNGVNECMMCHEAARDCDACHVREKVDIGKMPGIYQRTIPVEPALPPVKVDTNATPTMSACIHCHATLDDMRDESVIFAHDTHIKRSYDCDTCHKEFPHRSDKTTVPEMLTCYQCHGLTHAAQGEVATEKCEDCHPPKFELEPKDHTVAFKSGTHKKPAVDDTTRCTMCHKSDFCADCHAGGQRLADGRKSPIVLPANHRKPEWKPDHGQLFLSQQGACSTCHTTQSCNRCHVTPMPHPADWLTGHGEIEIKDKDCNVCHADRSTCQDCHHNNLDSQQLVAKNCVGCHEVMKNPKPTTIKNTGLAEHAVHFKVEERTGEPYVCNDCHIGFSQMKVSRPKSPTQAHDLRLCYDCHGALDIDQTLIAPWPGSELCRRCHTDLQL